MKTKHNKVLKGLEGNNNEVTGVAVVASHLAIWLHIFFQQVTAWFGSIVFDSYKWVLMLCALIGVCRSAVFSLVGTALVTI